jgi:hypothetical protein
VKGRRSILATTYYRYLVIVQTTKFPAVLGVNCLLELMLLQ